MVWWVMFGERPGLRSEEGAGLRVREGAGLRFGEGPRVCSLQLRLVEKGVAWFTCR